MDTYFRDIEQLHPTTQYAVEAAAGARKVCRYEREACYRHLLDLARVGDDDFPYVFDESRANRLFSWFECCCYHVRGPFSGQRIALLPWQKFDIGCKYGWVHKDSGKRRFRKAYNKRARGNVKSTEMSALALYGMCSDLLYPPGRPELSMSENSPEVECAAVDRDQAKRVWSDACEMGKMSPDISKRLRIKRTYVQHVVRGGFLRPLSKDTKNKDGGAPCLVVLDEYHAHPTSEIHDTLYSGFGKRAQPMMEIITTAGNNAENSPCLKEEEYAKRIACGEIENDSYFAMIRELDDGDNPHDENVWIKANPILQEDNEYSKGLLEQIRDEHRKAFDSGDPGAIREFLTKRCDLWQSGDENRFMDGCMDIWKSLAIPKAEFDALIAGKEATIGLDLGKTSDLTACAGVVALDDERFAVWSHGYMPEDGARRHEQSDRVPYIHWVKEGWCTLTEGAVTDYRAIGEDLRALKKHLKLVEICYDPHNATHLSQEMTADGYTMIEVRQNIMNLTESTKRFRELVLQRRIVHDGSPLLTWCLGNAVEVNDSNGNIRISKKHKDDTQRVDALSALINACVRAFALQQKSSGGFFFV